MPLPSVSEADRVQTSVKGLGTEADPWGGEEEGPFGEQSLGEYCPEQSDCSHLKLF